MPEPAVVAEPAHPAPIDLLQRADAGATSAWRRDASGLLAVSEGAIAIAAPVPPAYDAEFAFTLPDRGSLIITLVHDGRTCDWTIGDAGAWGLSLPRSDDAPLVPPPPRRGVRHVAQVHDRPEGLTVSIDGEVVDEASADRVGFSETAAPARIVCTATTSGIRIHSAQLTAAP
jgi:hypothetical protein